MLNDDTKVVAYKHTYMSHGGYPVTTINVWDYERESKSIEDALAELIKSRPEDEHIVMTFAEFYDMDREMTLATGVHEVHEDTFYGMLNVLPPLKWCDRTSEKHGCKVNEFCMSEFDHSVYTQQYARAYVDGKTRYYSATVDYYDESTWIHNRI